MKIALIMPPMDSGEGRNSFFRVLHDFSKGKPHFNRIFKPLISNKRLIDFETYPYGLIQLSTQLTEKNHEVKIYNFLLEKTSINDIIKFYPDVIGFTCSIGGQLIWIDKVSRYLKKKLGSVIIFGGPHVTLSPKQTIRTTVADYVLKGEADYTFLNLLDFIQGKIDKLPKEGICYINKKKKIVNTPLVIIKNLDRLPIPDHSLINVKDYRTINLELSRGCNRKCPFCYISGFDGKNYWRPHSLNRKFKELKQIEDLVNIDDKRIRLLDLDFAADHSIVKNFCNYLIFNKFKSEFLADCVVYLNKDMLNKMDKAGFSQLSFGVETGSSILTKRFNKISKKKIIFDLYRNISKTNISPLSNIILMNPDETKLDILNTLKMCRKLSEIPTYNPRTGSKGIFLTHLFRPYPKTQEYFSLINKGWCEPKSFQAWGKYFEEVSLGNFTNYNFTRGVSKSYLYKILFGFTKLNFNSFLLPRSRFLLKKINYRKVK